MSGEPSHQRMSSKIFNSKKPMLSRSFKLHRPRGYLCGIGMCPNCMMRVEGIPNIRVCTLKSVRISHPQVQNNFPVLDDLGITKLFSALLTPGFQYKHFNNSRLFSKLFYKTLKKTTGLGELPARPGKKIPCEKIEVDNLVIGGGSSGMQVALSIANGDSNAKGMQGSVLIVDSFEKLGGEFELRWGITQPYSEKLRTKKEKIESMTTQIASNKRIRCLLNTTVVGYYRDENCFLAYSDDSMYEITAKNVCIATGGHEILPVFPNNDSPRVVLSLAAQILLNDRADLPSSAIVLDINGQGPMVAADLVERGGMDSVKVVRSGKLAEDENALCLQKGVEALTETMVTGVTAGGVVNFLSTSIGKTGRIKTGLLVVCGRYQPNFEIALQLNLDVNLQWEGKTVFIVKGQDTKNVSPAAFTYVNLRDESASTKACAEPSLTRTIDMDITPDEYTRRFAKVKNSFVCLCEDVTAEDICESIEEGYDHIESLKRYTGCLTGPCQGKQCALTVASILYMMNPHSTGFLTTARQPAQPLPISSLVSE